VNGRHFRLRRVAQHLDRGASASSCLSLWHASSRWGAARLVLVALVTLVLGGTPSVARADWLLVPLVGTAFGGETTLRGVRGAERAHILLGGSAAWLSDHVLGVEGDVAVVPRYFEGNALDLVAGSNLMTVSGGIIAAVPVAVTREGLRPFLVGGLGLLHARAERTVEVLQVFEDVADDLLAMNVGGGAVGFISARTGVRFEIRHFRSLDRDRDIFSGRSRTRLSFWRASVGVVVRY
jgi:hypothetical protein